MLNSYLPPPPNRQILAQNDRETLNNGGDEE